MRGSTKANALPGAFVLRSTQWTLRYRVNGGLNPILPELTEHSHVSGSAPQTLDQLAPLLVDQKLQTAASAFREAQLVGEAVLALRQATLAFDTPLVEVRGPVAAGVWEQAALHLLR